MNRAVESVSAFFPCYNDEATIGTMVEAAAATLDRVGADGEIIVVNDGSSDGSERVLKHLTETEPRLRVVTHEHNRGYGGALLSGFGAATKQWVFYTDGDGQFDPTELELLVARATDDIDVVQGYKLNRADNVARRAIGRVYHRFVSFVFGLHVRDTDCDFRLMRRSMLERVRLEKTTGVICVELVRTLQDAGARFVEVGVHHYPRVHGRSQFFKLTSVARTLWDLAKLWVQLVVLRRGKIRTAAAALAPRRHDDGRRPDGDVVASQPPALGLRERREDPVQGAALDVRPGVVGRLGPASLEHGQQRRRRGEKRVRVRRPPHPQPGPLGEAGKLVAPVAAQAVHGHVVGAAERRERGLEEQQRAPGAQDPRQLAEGRDVVAHGVEQRDAHRDVERPVGEREALRARQHRRRRRPACAHELQGLLCQVDADHPAVAREPRAVPARAAAGVEDALVGAEPRLQELGHERPGVAVPPVVVFGRRDAGVLLDLHQPMIVSSLSVRSQTRLSRSRKRSSSGAISSLYAGSPIMS